MLLPVISSPDGLGLRWCMAWPLHADHLLPWFILWQPLLWHCIWQVGPLSYFLYHKCHEFGIWHRHQLLPWLRHLHCCSIPCGTVIQHLFQHSLYLRQDQLKVSQDKNHVLRVPPFLFQPWNMYLWSAGASLGMQAWLLATPSVAQLSLIFWEPLVTGEYFTRSCMHREPLSSSRLCKN